jgi:hypothetical protein
MHTFWIVNCDMEPKLFQGYLEWDIHVHWVFCFMNVSTTCIKHIQIELELFIVLIIHLVLIPPWKTLFK